MPIEDPLPAVRSRDRGVVVVARPGPGTARPRVHHHGVRRKRVLEPGSERLEHEEPRPDGQGCRVAPTRTSGASAGKRFGPGHGVGARSQRNRASERTSPRCGAAAVICKGSTRPLGFPRRVVPGLRNHPDTTGGAASAHQRMAGSAAAPRAKKTSSRAMSIGRTSFASRARSRRRPRPGEPEERPAARERGVEAATRRPVPDRVVGREVSTASDHTVGPNGLQRSPRWSREQQHRPSGGSPAHEIVTESEQRQEGRKDEASVDIRPDDRDDGHQPGPAVSLARPQPGPGEERYGQRLGPAPDGSAATINPKIVSMAAVRGGAPARRQFEIQEAETCSNGRGIGMAHPHPTAEPMPASPTRPVLPTAGSTRAIPRVKVNGSVRGSPAGVQVRASPFSRGRRGRSLSSGVRSDAAAGRTPARTAHGGAMLSRRAPVARLAETVPFGGAPIEESYGVISGTPSGTKLESYVEVRSQLPWKAGFPVDVVHLG